MDRIKKSIRIDFFSALYGETTEEIDVSGDNMKINAGKSDFLNEMKQSWEDLKEIFTLKHIRIPTFHIMLTFWNQNVTGIPALMMFSNAIFQRTGIPTEYIGLASLGFFVVNFISSFGCGLVVDKWGRKLTYTISGIGMGACLFLVFVLSFFDDKIGVSYAIIAPVCLFNGFSQLGLMPIPFMLASELIGIKHRATVQSIGVFNGFLSHFIVVTVFPLLIQSIDQYVFLIFGVFDFLSVLHIWFVNFEMGKDQLDELHLKRSSSFIKLQ